MNVGMGIALIWGIAVILLYGTGLRRRIASWRKHHDPRASRELLSGMALFIAALASGLSIVVVTFAIDGPALRTTLGSIAWGTFTAAGVLYAHETRPEETP